MESAETNTTAPRRGLQTTWEARCGVCGKTYQKGNGVTRCCEVPEETPAPAAPAPNNESNESNDTEPTETTE